MDVIGKMYGAWNLDDCSGVENTRSVCGRVRYLEVLLSWWTWSSSFAFLPRQMMSCISVLFLRDPNSVMWFISAHQMALSLAHMS